MPADASANIPKDSLIFGYGPMLPFLAAALGAWLLPPPWPHLARDMAILWGALILAFLAGVRRGFGFGAPQASANVAIATMLLYFIGAGAALLLAWLTMPVAALALLLASYVLVPALDRHAALTGNAPAHFAKLRPPQMILAALSLAALLLRDLI